MRTKPISITSKAMPTPTKRRNSRQLNYPTYVGPRFTPARDVRLKCCVHMYLNVDLVHPPKRRGSLEVGRLGGRVDRELPRLEPAHGLLWVLLC